TPDRHLLITSPALLDIRRVSHCFSTLIHSDHFLYASLQAASYAARGRLPSAHQHCYAQRSGITLESETLWITLCATGLQGGGELCVREFGQQQEVARGQGGFAELAQAHLISTLLQVERAVEQQPDFQWPAEQPRYQLQVAHLGQSLPALLFQSLPVVRLPQLQVVVGGQVPAEVGNPLAQGALRT